MLVLQRKKEQRIIICNNDIIIITIVDILRDRVRIGIDAPNDVTVHREEVWERIQSGEVR